MSHPLVLAEGVRHSYASEEVLRGFGIGIDPGEVVAIMGPSGCGKSTAILAVSGLLVPSSGRVRIAGHEITGRNAAERAALRRRLIGLVFQFGELVAELSLLDNIALAAELAGCRRRDAVARTRALLAAVGIAELGDRHPGEVSGGQRQRAAVARAVVHEPRVILADEPTGALDSESAAQVLELFLTVAAERGCAVVMATHDPDVAARAHRVCHMADGRLVPAVTHV